MAVSAERIAKNTTYLTMALVVQKVIAFLFFLIVARWLGSSDTGEYVAAFAFSSFFGIFVDLGLSPVMIRELARAPEETDLYLRAVTGFKILSGVIVYIALLASVMLLSLFGFHHPDISIVAIAGLVMLLDSVVLTGTSVFRAWQNTWYESVIIIVNKLVVIAFGILALWLFRTATAVAMSMLVGSATSLLLLMYYLRQRIPHPWWPKFDRTIWRRLWVMAMPFAVAGIFAAAYAQLDSILLSTLKGNGAVGLYSVASKTMNAFAFIPAAFVAALYPALSATSQDKDRLGELTRIALRYLLLVGALLGMGLFMLADQYVHYVGVGYATSAMAVRILMPSLVFAFLSYPLGALLNATNRQVWQTGIIAGGTVVNAALNLYLIPSLSFIGASIAWSITNALVLVIGIILVTILVGISLRPLWISFLRALIALAAMAAMMLVLETHYWSVIIVALVGFATYVAVLWILREVTIQDIRFVRNLWAREARSETLPNDYGK